MVFRFGGHVLDTERRELRRGAELVALEPQVFDLLAYLVRNRGRVVSKDDLIDGVWGGRIVSDSALTTRLNAARKAVNDSGAAQRVIRTLARKGVRFVAEVTEDGLLEVPAAAPEPPLALTDKPSIAVLPFTNLSGDPEQEYFADGMVEETITALSRIRWLFVIARNSSFTYKGQAIDVRQVGRELGVRYVLEGSVRRAGGQVRITGQLVDALSGMHVWAGHFDGSLEDVFELQDQIALGVAGVIEPALQAAEIRRSTAHSTSDVTAYDFYLRALAAFFPVTKEGVIEAQRLLEQAIAIDPRYAPALSWAAHCHLRLVVEGWADESETSRRKAVDLARRALQLVEHDPVVLTNAAQVLARSGEDIGAMIDLVDRALALNPSYARGWFVSGLLRVWAGRLDLGIEHIETSVRLSPRERVGSTLFVIGMAYFFKRQFAEAASQLLASFQDHPGYPQPYRFLAACYVHMGRLDEARAIVARLRAITPLVVPTALPWRNPEHRELLLSGLRRAAGEET
jgi:TolB-like protein